jgi:hypothetical protein
VESKIERNVEQASIEIVTHLESGKHLDPRRL